MIIVSSFKLNHNNSSGFFTITAEEIYCCPYCNGELLYRDSRLRKLINIVGEIIYFLLRRLRCQNCKKLHTELPSVIHPYKHYDSDTIQSVLDNSEDGKMCTADNSTIRRWKNEFAEAEPDINQRLASVYTQMTDERIPIAVTVNILDRIKIETKHWLSFVTELLINSGHKICTQFAFCPSSTHANVNSVSKNVSEGGRKDDKTIKDTS